MLDILNNPHSDISYMSVLTLILLLYSTASTPGCTCVLENSTPTCCVGLLHGYAWGKEVGNAAALVSHLVQNLYCVPFAS